MPLVSIESSGFAGTLSPSIMWTLWLCPRCQMYGAEFSASTWHRFCSKCNYEAVGEPMHLPGGICRVQLVESGAWALLRMIRLIPPGGVERLVQWVPACAGMTGGEHDEDSQAGSKRPRVALALKVALCGNVIMRIPNREMSGSRLQPSGRVVEREYTLPRWTSVHA
jgi:hypothetical protein